MSVENQNEKFHNPVGAKCQTNANR